MFENNYNMYDDAGWFWIINSLTVITALARLLLKNIMNFFDFWNYKKPEKRYPLERIKKSLMDNSLSSAANMDKLMVTDAFRVHFLKHNKKWII